MKVADRPQNVCKEKAIKLYNEHHEDKVTSPSNDLTDEDYDKLQNFGEQIMHEMEAELEDGNNKPKPTGTDGPGAEGENVRLSLNDKNGLVKAELFIKESLEGIHRNKHFKIELPERVVKRIKRETKKSRLMRLCR